MDVCLILLPMDDGLGLLTSNIWPTVQELLDPITLVKSINQGLHGDASSDEAQASTQCVRRADEEDL